MMKPTAFFSPDIHPGRAAGMAYRPLPEDVVVGSFGGIPATILAALIEGPCHTGRLLEIVYRGSVEPPNGRHSIYNAIATLRERLRPGWRIDQKPDPHHPRWYRHYVLRRV